MKNNRPLEVGQVRMVPMDNFLYVINKINNTTSTVIVRILDGDNKGETRSWLKWEVMEDIVVM